MYNSILSKTSTKVDNAPSVVKGIMKSYKERFIKIVVKSARLTDKQEDIFRDMVDSAILYRNAKYIKCTFPKSLVGYLVAASNKTLKKEDFRGFSTVHREWDFDTDLWRVHFLTMDSRLNLKDLLKIPENKVFNYTYDVVRFGKTVVIRGNDVIYVWVDGLHKIVACMNTESNGMNRPLDYVVE
jgi:hypothetical protein